MLLFDEIYATDLRYVADCWTHCGDAHCCSFARYKSYFQVIGKAPSHELLLLPGEYEYLTQRGWLEQFGDFTHTVSEFALSRGKVRLELISSRRHGCVCDQDTRPVVCRLYPLLPIYDVSGKLSGTEPLSIYEELEDLQRLAPVCKVTSIPFSELQKFLKIATALSNDPVALFYMMAYRLAKQHVKNRLAAARADTEVSIFLLFEKKLLSGSLIDAKSLASQLDALATEFQKHYQDRFSLDKHC